MPTTAHLPLLDWSNVRADLAWIYEGTVEPAHRDMACRPNLLGAWLVLAGAAAFTQAGRTWRARPGEWLIIRQGGGHQHFSDDARILSVRFSAEWPDRRPFFDEGLSLVLAAARAPRLAVAARALLEVARPHIPAHTNQLPWQSLTFGDFVGLRRAFWAWLLELHDALAAVGVEPTRTLLQDERIVRVLRQLDQLPLATRLREREIAQTVGLQVGHFVRVFRQQVGKTPKRYFEGLRHAACVQRLAGTEEPIKQIALDLGFARLSDFSTWFRRLEGIAPRQFRARHHTAPTSPL